MTAIDQSGLVSLEHCIGELRIVRLGPLLTDRRQQLDIRDNIQISAMQ
jgi:hypothetical protein